MLLVRQHPTKVVGLGISEPSNKMFFIIIQGIRDSIVGGFPVKPILLPYCWWLTRNPAMKKLTGWELVVEIPIILPGFLATSKRWLFGISEPSTVGHLPTRPVPLHLPLWLYIMFYIMFWLHAAFSLKIEITMVRDIVNLVQITVTCIYIYIKYHYIILYPSWWLRWNSDWNTRWFGLWTHGTHSRGQCLPVSKERF